MKFKKWKQISSIVEVYNYIRKQTHKILYFSAFVLFLCNCWKLAVNFELKWFYHVASTFTPPPSPAPAALHSRKKLE